MWLICVECFIALGAVCLLMAATGRRSIEAYAFAVSFWGYLLSGIGLYLNGLLWEYRERAVWLEDLCSLVYWPCAYLTLGFGLAWLFRCIRSAPAKAAVLLLPGILGTIAGYLYASYEQNFTQMISYTNWYALFLLPAAPADLIVNHMVLDGADWQGGEMEAYSIEIALFSGLVWLMMSAGIALPLHFLRRRLTQRCNEPALGVSAS